MQGQCGFKRLSDEDNARLRMNRGVHKTAEGEFGSVIRADRKPWFEDGRCIAICVRIVFEPSLVLSPRVAVLSPVKLPVET